MSDLPYRSPISISHIDLPIISCHSGEVLAPQGYEARRRLVEFVEDLDGQGLVGQGLDGQELDGPRLDGHGLDGGQGMDGQGMDGQAGAGRRGAGAGRGGGVGYTMGKPSRAPESPANLESSTAGLRRRLCMLNWSVCTIF